MKNHPFSMTINFIWAVTVVIVVCNIVSVFESKQPENDLKDYEPPKLTLDIKTKDKVVIDQISSRYTKTLVELCYNFGGKSGKQYRVKIINREGYMVAGNVFKPDSYSIDSRCLYFPNFKDEPIILEIADWK